MIRDWSTPQSEEQKSLRRNKYKETKRRNKTNELKARMLDSILCLAEDEFVKAVETYVSANGKFYTEIQIEKILKEWPWLEDYEVKFEHKRVKVDRYSPYIDAA